MQADHDTDAVGAANVVEQLQRPPRIGGVEAGNRLVGQYQRGLLRQRPGNADALGWVVSHYGRWVWSSRYGWVWVAGDAWGPALVEWCYGDGYVGWAPMPPHPYWQGTTYYGSYECGSPRYYSRAVFVSETYFASPRVSAHVVASSRNATVARGTINVTSYSRAGSGIVNRSIDIARLQAATGVAIKPALLPVSGSSGRP